MDRLRAINCRSNIFSCSKIRILRLTAAKTRGFLKGFGVGSVTDRAIGLDVRLFGVPVSRTGSRIGDVPGETQKHNAQVTLKDLLLAARTAWGRAGRGGP